MRFVLLAVIGLVVLVAACGDGDDAYRIRFEVTASDNAPTGYVVQPGERIADAELQIFAEDETTLLSVARTDGDGIATTDIPGPGRYAIWVSADAGDPLCSWGQKLNVVVDERTTTVRFDNVNLACV